MTCPTRHRSRPSPDASLALVASLLAAMLVLSLALAPRAEALIYWSRGDGINRANLDGSGVDQLFITSADMSHDEFGDVAVDAGHIYWTDWADPPGIGRANLDGTDVDQSFMLLSPADDIAVDARFIYWASSDGIGRANLDGSGIDPTFIDDIITGSVVVDARFIYWTYRECGTGPTGEHECTAGIARANLAGTGADTDFISVLGGEAPEFHDQSLAVNDVAVDANHIYWSQSAGLSNAADAIVRANLDGSNVDPLISVGPVYDIAIDAGHIYWLKGWKPLNHPGYAIGRANLDGTGAEHYILSLDPANSSGLTVDGLTDTELAGTASAARTQKPLRRRIRVRVMVQAKEPLTVEASGKIKFNPAYKLKPKTVELVESALDPQISEWVFIDTPIQTETLKLKSRRAQAKKIADAWSRGERAKAKLRVKLTDAAGNSATERLRVKLKRG